MTWRKVFFCLTAASLLLTGCAATHINASVSGQQILSTAASGSSLDLRGVCPTTVTIQTNWWPQAEDGSLYHLLGGRVAEDAGHKRASAALTVAGVNTGVTIQISSGGPANSYTPAVNVLYLDDSVQLGAVDVDQAARLANSQPVVPVFAPMAISPLVLLWDPSSLPAVKSIPDLGRANTQVLYYTGSTYMDYLSGSGVLRQSQIDGSYDGTPSRFVAAGGAIAQQGYLTREVYQYEHELPQWGKRVAWQLVNDLGYPNYPEALAVRADRKTELAPCLRRLVPIMQRSAVDYLADPSGTNQLISKLVNDFGAYPYSIQNAAYAVGVMKQYGIMGNRGTGAIGGFELTRVQQLIDIMRPIYGRQGTPLPVNLTASALVTNEFIDPSISTDSN